MTNFVPICLRKDFLAIFVKYPRRKPKNTRTGFTSGRRTRRRPRARRRGTRSFPSSVFILSKALNIHLLN